MLAVASTLGWFSRIIQISIEFDGPYDTDSAEEFALPWDSFTDSASIDYYIYLFNVRHRELNSKR